MIVNYSLRRNLGFLPGAFLWFGIPEVIIPGTPLHNVFRGPEWGKPAGFRSTSPAGPSDTFRPSGAGTVNTFSNPAITKAGKVFR